jgi:hypothetical protein
MYNRLVLGKWAIGEGLIYSVDNIKIDNNNQEELGNFLTADSEFLKAEYFLSGKTVDEICFDLKKESQMNPCRKVRVFYFSEGKT